jgi:hypothetical protein
MEGMKRNKELKALQSNRKPYVFTPDLTEKSKCEFM